ncbi:hypothetical protein NDU88_004098 [Pleurodeles waltl]|uniref:Uncharacterized protein n=1 Tax=Pleurodeles waltl TaxID=8319 RepID=A0AAV7L3N9_PLEWA|nr:hypothetical protein NDU88_004098 [Pleurodeles waltl]
MRCLSCSRPRESVCIPCTAARSRLSEACCEKGQSPTEMKERKALASPPLAFTPEKRKKNTAQGHLTESGANKLPLSGMPNEPTAWLSDARADKADRTPRGSGDRKSKCDATGLREAVQSSRALSATLAARAAFHSLLLTAQAAVITCLNTRVTTTRESVCY